MQPGGGVSPLHYWGYIPRLDDVMLAHRLNRVEIKLRAWLGGLDPTVFGRTWWHLTRGAGAIYAVTQPDVWQALPWLRRRFPACRIVTWAWMGWEVDRHLKRLRACDHVLCLTDSAKRRMDECGLAERASLAIWGCDPAHYRVGRTVSCDTDIFIGGLTARDSELMRQAIASQRWRVCLTRESHEALGWTEGVGKRGRVVDISTEQELVTAYHRCAVTWIPLKAGDPYPSGYTNLIESLLCGTAVVIGDSSSIPRSVLTLPGVFRYRTGALADFVARTDEAIAFMRAPETREAIATAAAERLNGRELGRTVRRELGLDAQTPAACES